MQALLEQDSSWSSRLATLPIDVSSEASVAAARDALAQRFAEESAPLYALVNNAGIGLGSNDVAAVLQVNTHGVKRVCDAFLPLLQHPGRVVTVSSASAPNFVSQCAGPRQQFFIDATQEWGAIATLIDQVVEHQHDPGKLQALGLGELNAYGFSKACASLYTLGLARQYPQLLINACTPGYIETDLTRPQAERRGLSPAELGMKPTEQGTVAILHLLFSDAIDTGHYYGSDARRSPLDRYRAPGTPEYSGD